MPTKPILTAICELTYDELTGWCASCGEAAYRARQIRHWVFQRRATEFDAMDDVPKRLREALQQSFTLLSSHIARHRVADDGTEKLLLELCDGKHVECVLMREAERRTVCVSTQVGCAMGCVFCASGLQGVERNLATHEIVEQFLHLDRLLPDGERLTNVVVMGMGEPLANLTALLPALQTVGAEDGLGLGARRITVSTVGLPDKMRRLARCGKQYNLAVSLHAPNDELRNELVPANRKIGLKKVLAAADDFFDQTGRRVTYEYVMLSGINDQPKHARQLAALLKQRNAHVNLIPMNAVSTLAFQQPTALAVERFIEILNNAGVAATARKRKGAGIDAACGQLRLSHTSNRAH